MSRLTNTPPHLGRKIIGMLFMLTIVVVIAIGAIQKAATGPTANNSTPSVTPTPVTASALPTSPTSPAPPIEVLTCHKAVDVANPPTTEQAFIDRVWEYESTYLSDDAAHWQLILQTIATSQYQQDNHRPVSESPSAITTSIIPSGSTITWNEDATLTRRNVSTIACILVKDGENAITLPHHVPPHHTTWIKTQTGWRIDHATDQGW